MKKILFTLICSMLSITMMAQSDNPKYLKGAVPQDDNGLVVFSQKFAIEGKSQTEIYNVLKPWAASIAQDAIHDLRTRIIDEKEAEGLVIYRIEEWLVFKRHFLILDRTRMRYQLCVKCDNGMAEITISQISYYYEEDDHGENGNLYKAEEWITDKEALNKKGTKMYKYSRKFRIKTIDRVQELFESARACFDPVEKNRATTVIQ